MMQEGYTLEGARQKLQGRSSVPQDTPQTQAIRQAVAELEKVVEDSQGVVGDEKVGREDDPAAFGYGTGCGAVW